MKEELKQIIQHYGIDHQLRKFNEECFELEEAIIIYENEIPHCDPIADAGYIEMLKKHITGEIADVTVMLKQFQYYYEIEDKEIEEVMNFKIKRQLDRITNEVSNDRN